MPETRAVRVAIQNEDSIFMAIGEIRIHCQQIGFDEPITQKIVTAASELCYNIIKYAGKGHVEITSLLGETNGIKIRALDRGPGIKDIELAMSDKYSTGGTLGLGLPSIKRMMDEFHIDTKPGSGTIVTVVKRV